MPRSPHTQSSAHYHVIVSHSRDSSPGPAAGAERRCRTFGVASRKRFSEVGASNPDCGKLTEVAHGPCHPVTQTIVIFQARDNRTFSAVCPPTPHCLARPAPRLRQKRGRLRGFGPKPHVFRSRLFQGQLPNLCPRHRKLETRFFAEFPFIVSNRPKIRWTLALPEASVNPLCLALKPLREAKGLSASTMVKGLGAVKLLDAHQIKLSKSFSSKCYSNYSLALLRLLFRHHRRHLAETQASGERACHVYCSHKTFVLRATCACKGRTMICTDAIAPCQPIAQAALEVGHVVDSSHSRISAQNKTSSKEHRPIGTNYFSFLARKSCQNSLISIPPSLSPKKSPLCHPYLLGGKSAQNGKLPEFLKTSFFSVRK